MTRFAFGEVDPYDDYAEMPGLLPFLKRPKQWVFGGLTFMVMVQKQKMYQQVGYFLGLGAGYHPKVVYFEVFWVFSRALEGFWTIALHCIWLVSSWDGATRLDNTIVPPKKNVPPAFSQSNFTGWSGLCLKQNECLERFSLRTNATHHRSWMPTFNPTASTKPKRECRCQHPLVLVALFHLNLWNYWTLYVSHTQLIC